MTTSRTILFIVLAIVWSYVLGLQRPPPRYSQQYMPQTSFSCRNKIVGSYYADPETDCQLFHVCVSVAGSIQDYRFLCPNDTAFDQESQTCADWYDVDCEAATLYYASDNFDLYRIGSGLESLHYDSIRSDYEPQDHLQRSESNDPIRSPLNSYNNNNYKDAEAPKQNSINKSNQFSSRNQNHVNGEVEKNKNVRENQESEKKVNVRKINRKPVNNGFTNVYTSKSTTIAPAAAQQLSRYNDNMTYGQENLPYTKLTSLRPSIVSNSQKSKQASVSTLRPTPKYAAAPSAVRSTSDSQDMYTNYQTTTKKSTFYNNNLNRFETTKPTNAIRTHYPEPQSYSTQFSQATSPATQSSSSSDYQQYNQGNNYDQRIYNNYNSNYVHRPNSTTYTFSSTTVPNQYNRSNYNNNNNNNYNNYNTFDNHHPSKKLADYNSNSYTANTYAPTTYSPITKKYASNRQYYDKSTTLTTKSAHENETDFTKASKKITNYKAHHNYDTSTRSYDFSRSSVGLGFSPSSVNHLAEDVRSTTPIPRRGALPTTYNPNNFHLNSQAAQIQITQEKSTYYQNQSAKQYSTTVKYAEETTTRPKITKKNDYDYAYYDNGPLEYDSIELEHVSSNKESVKIT